MASSLDPAFCPFCGAIGIDITLLEDSQRRYLCRSDPKHEWTEGQNPPEQDGAMELSEVAEAIAQCVARKIEKPSLTQRVFALFGK